MARSVKSVGLPLVEAMTVFAPTVAPFFRVGGVKHIGGAETQIYLLANMLARRGARVRLLTVNMGHKPPSQNAAVGVVNTWRSASPLPVKALGLLRRIVASPSPIYARAPSLVNALVALLARALGKRVVIGLASDLSCVPNWRSPGRTLTTWVCLKLSSQVIAQTRDQQNLLRRHFSTSSAVFHNVVERAKFSSARTVPYTDRDIDVLWTGTIEPRKGLDRVIEVAERLPQLKFVVLGGPYPSAADYFKRFTNQVAELPNVMAPGFAEPDLVPSWMGRSKVLIHASIPLYRGLTKEGFPNVFLEAWASGLPVVSLSVDPDGLLATGGLGYKCGSVDEAVAVIDKLCQDEEQWASTQLVADTYVRERDVDNPAVTDELFGILAGGRDDRSN